MVYYHLPQRPEPVPNLVVRVSNPPETVIPEVRRTLRELNSNLPVDDVSRFSDYVSRSLVQQKLVARLAAFFGLLALMLACIGLYGVLSYSVARRTNEIGIRMALGATPAGIGRLIARQSLPPVLFGLAAGLAGSAALGRVIRSMLFQVPPYDPVTLTLAVAAIAAATPLAIWWPVRRATRVECTVALREE